MLAPGTRIGPYEVLAPLGAALTRRGEFFFTSRGSMWAASARTSPTFAAEAPRELFRIPEEVVLGSFGFYDDVTPDGQRFVMIQKDPFEIRPIELALIPKWLEELKARMAAAR